MDRALATLRLPDGTTRTLAPGELIGRLWSAAIQIDDPRVSEGHAMLSLRGGELWLLALRRRLALDGRSLAELRLEVGQRIALAQGLEVVVEAIELPTAVLGLEAPGLPPTMLPGVCSLQVRPQIVLSARHEPGAACRIWDSGDGWRRTEGDRVVPLAPGDTWSVEGVPLRVVRMALSGAGPSPTRVTGGIDSPLRIVTAWDSAQIQAGDARASPAPSRWT